MTDPSDGALLDADASPDPRAEPPPAPGERKGAIKVQTQFSGGFGDWLIRHRVGLVCSTYQTGHLLFMGARPDGRPVPSAAGFSRAMGIVAHPQRIYVGTKTEIWRLENILRADELDNEMFDRLYVPRNAQVTGDINIHEMGVEPNGRILFCNTRYSCLAAISQTHAFKPLWQPKFISRLAPEDRCHLNGLAMEGGRARYVTCCGTGDSVESWRGGRRDGGVLVDIESDVIVAEGLSMPHSPRVVGEAIYFIESGRGAIVRLDRKSGSKEDVTFCPGFARGLALVSHYAVLTISLPRSVSFSGLPLAQSMKARGAPAWRGLLIVDLRNGDIVEWLRLEGDVMELFDVGVISNARCPRGIGPYAPGLEETMRGEELVLQA
jgi:uncharacterized protein (TIGR03032 family)